MPKVSVVMPTFNQEGYVLESVRSVLSQTFEDFELIIVNDGCTDSTPRLLQRIRDERVKIKKQANQGASSALNHGFNVATGEYLTWLASDNLYKPEFLQKAAQFLDTHPEIGLVYASFENIDADGRLIDYTFLEPYYPGLLQINPGAVGIAFLYRRSVYEQCGKYEDLICNDLDYWLKAERSFRFSFVPEVLASNRKHPQMQTVKRKKELAGQIKHLLEREKEAGIVLPDPSLLSLVVQLKRVTEQLVSALKFRCPQIKKGLEIAVVGESPLREIVTAVLRGRGYVARGYALQDWEGSEREACLALSKKIEEALVGSSERIIPIGCVRSKNFGMDF